MNQLSNESHVATGRRGNCVVMKFGGTSVEDAAAIRRVSQLVKRRLRHRPVVVVSALARVTDQLLSAARSSAEGGPQGARETVERLRQRHQTVARELVEEQQFHCLWAELEPAFQMLDNLAGEIASTGALLPEVQDRFLAVGEFLSSKILHAALLRAGFDVAWVDSKQCIVTDAAYTRATPLWEDTRARSRAILLPVVHSGQIPVLGGFVGATREGIPTTLGRGGSDCSAAMIGVGLEASRIEIWTDVDGVMTTDPNLCPDARRITTLSFHEAAELAHFGARVLHPATIAPAMRRNIPVWVLNSRNPQSGGTEIVAHASEIGRVKAITAKREVAVLDFEPAPWMGSDLPREVFQVFERHPHSVELLSASPHGFSLVMSSATDLPAIAEELRGVANVRCENHKALVCLVGEKIRRRPEIASQILHAISDLEVRLLCQGPSERTISFLVDEARAEETVRRLHELLFSTPAHLAGGLARVLYQPGGTC
jgi:aspartate kinase